MGAAASLAIVSVGLWSWTDSRKAEEAAAREKARQQAIARFILTPSVPEPPGTRDLDALRTLGRTLHRIRTNAFAPADWDADVHSDARAVEAVGNAASGGSYTKEDREAFRLAAWYAKFTADLVARQTKDGSWQHSAGAEREFEAAAAAFDASLAKATRAAKERG